MEEMYGFSDVEVPPRRSKALGLVQPRPAKSRTGAKSRQQRPVPSDSYECSMASIDWKLDDIEFLDCYEEEDIVLLDEGHDDDDDDDDDDASAYQNTSCGSDDEAVADDENEHDDDCIDDDNGLSSHIAYLKEKQRLLLRASRFFAAEETYNAANASIDARGPQQPEPRDSIWSQAKEYLSMHGLIDGGEEEDVVNSRDSDRGMVDRDRETEKGFLVWDPTANCYHDRRQVAAANANAKSSTKDSIPQRPTKRSRHTSSALIDISTVDHITAKNFPSPSACRPIRSVG
jgi:hypothetical protein